MTFTDFSRRLQFVLRANAALLAGFAVLLPTLLLIVSLAIGSLSPPGYFPCWPDYFISLCRPQMFSMIFVLPSVFVLLQLFKHDFSISFVLREKSRRSIFTAQAVQILFFSFAVSLYMTVLIALIGRCRTGLLYNWDQPDSLMAYFTHATVPRFPLFLVPLYFFVHAFFCIAVMSLVVLLFRWGTGRQVIGFVLIAALGWADGFPLVNPFTRSSFTLSLFYTPISISYFSWHTPGTMGARFLYAAGWGIVLTVLGWMLVQKKDFCHEK